MAIPTEIQKILGGIIKGEVIEHLSYGVYVDIGHDEYVGLIQIIDFTDNSPMKADDYPKIGSALETVVIGFKSPNQIALSIKPCVLNVAKILS